jgi:hypothetical protein
MKEYWYNVYKTKDGFAVMGLVYYSKQEVIVAAIGMQPKVLYRIHVRLK